MKVEITELWDSGTHVLTYDKFSGPTSLQELMSCENVTNENGIKIDGKSVNLRLGRFYHPSGGGVIKAFEVL